MRQASGIIKTVISSVAMGKQYQVVSSGRILGVIYDSLHPLVLNKMIVIKGADPVPFLKLVRLVVILSGFIRLYVLQQVAYRNLVSSGLQGQAPMAIEHINRQLGMLRKIPPRQKSCNSCWEIIIRPFVQYSTVSVNP